MVETTLRPCPFCGEEPDAFAAGERHWITCISSIDQCAARPSVHGKTPEEAARLWNTRRRTRIAKHRGQG